MRGRPVQKVAIGKSAYAILTELTRTTVLIYISTDRNCPTTAPATASVVTATRVDHRHVRNLLCQFTVHVTVSTYLVRSELPFTRVKGSQCQGHHTLSGWANDSSDPGADCGLPQEIARLHHGIFRSAVWAYLSNI